jgi:hypothetical protein
MILFTRKKKFYKNVNNFLGDRMHLICNIKCCFGGGPGGKSPISFGDKIEYSS